MYTVLIDILSDMADAPTFQPKDPVLVPETGTSFMGG